MDENNLPHIKRLEEAMAEFSVVVKAKTPIFKGKPRDMGIKRYLSYHPYDRCIVIDDDKGEYSSVDGLTMLFTDSAKGFNAAALKKALKLI